MTEVKNEGSPDKGRRDFLKGMVGISTVVMLASLVDFGKLFEPINVVIPPWPKLKAANVNALQLNNPVSFAYPLTGTPALLVKLGQKVVNGVGPDGDIIAFSTVCQHLGCIVHFEPAERSGGEMPSFTDRPVAYCPCHGGVYDLANEAEVLAGPPPNPIPFVKIEFDDSTGDIYAVGMYPPVIFAKGPPGSTNTDLDKVGGTLVS